MIKKFEVFYKEEKCYLKNKEWIDMFYKEKNNLHIKDYFDNDLEITPAEKIIIDRLNELIDCLKEKNAEIEELKTDNIWWHNRYDAVKKQLDNLKRCGENENK